VNAYDSVTATDIDRLNRTAVARGAQVARRAGTALLVLGGIVVAGWLWAFLRQQGVLGGGDEGPFRFDSHPDVPARVDLTVTTISFLASGGILLGLGSGLRLVADYATARMGGSLAGVQVGDLIPPEGGWAPTGMPPGTLPPPPGSPLGGGGGSWPPG
jgi:hypothetical protein